jgi:hypothetical protein
MQLKVVNIIRRDVHLAVIEQNLSNPPYLDPNTVVVVSEIA